MPFKDQLAVMQIGAIKNMPEYDPDAEISALAFTVPSWTSSINRVRTNAKLSETSDNACERLSAAFDDLKISIDKTLSAIKERK